MLLPFDIYHALQPQFETHRCWHVARLASQYELRKKFPGECGPHLHSRRESGSGCDFLLHHRKMVRHFKWALGHVGSTYPYLPWPGDTLPPWLEALLHSSGFELNSAYRMIGKLVAAGSVDDLGGFLEANELHSGTSGAGTHNHVHRVIDAWERQLNPGDESAAMGNMGTAAGNAFFWKLHGWLDEIYAKWQRMHGEVPDQTPMKMEEPMIKCGPHNKTTDLEILRA